MNELLDIPGAFVLGSNDYFAPTIKNPLTYFKKDREIRAEGTAFPPTAASTIANKVVGTCTTRIPLSQVAATKPARSVVAPPPSEMITSLRVNPAFPRAIQQNSNTAEALAFSASGTSIEIDSTLKRLWRNFPAAACIDWGWITATRVAPSM
jgi:hypothetical protein